MNSEHISFEVLSRYHDGDFFPSSTKLSIEAHLKECAQCKRELEKIEKMRMILASLCVYEVSSSRSLSNKIMARIVNHYKSNEQRKQHRKKRYVLLPAAAAVAVVFIGIVFVRVEMRNDFSAQKNEYRGGNHANLEFHRIVDAMNAVRAVGATVIEVSDSYLLIEAPAEKLSHIQQTLHRYPIEIREYFTNRNALTISSPDVNIPSGRQLVKLKITLK
ncbi:MAG: hypothetical protein N2316_11865 [Spirochaetes bacterium]|nr:hypothetical protein [Spirochaetota bacterium]